MDGKKEYFHFDRKAFWLTFTAKRLSFVEHTVFAGALQECVSCLASRLMCMCVCVSPLRFYERISFFMCCFYGFI